MAKARYIFVLFFMVLNQLSVYAQLITGSSTDTISNRDTTALDATVACINMNILYRGLDNPISVSAPCCKYPIIVDCIGGTINGANGKYMVRPEEGDRVIILVSQIKRKKKFNIGIFQFRVKDIPTPEISWASKKSGEKVSARIVASSPLIPKMQDFDFAVYSVILLFDIKYDYNNKTIERKGLIGNVIPIDIAKEIRDLPSGTIVYFENIKIRLPGGEDRFTSATFIIE